MPNWTKEQTEAIEKSGSNIIVSAGAGSGKTAVLSERVIHHLNKGITIDKLLILTFTNAAAGEMKDRIRSKITDNLDLKDNLDLLESSYITTFDSYCLSLVKKYNYVLNVSSHLNIVNDALINNFKKKTIDEIFTYYYEKEDKDFYKLISDFCIKNDEDIKNSILKIVNSLDQRIDKHEYLETYISHFFDQEHISNLINEYMNLIYEEIDNIETNMYFLENSDFPEYYESLSKTLERLIKSKSYDDLKQNIDVNLPRLPRNSEDIKEYKDNISKSVNIIKDYLRFSSLNEIYETFDIAKKYTQIIIQIISDFNERITKYKNENDLYEFNDIELMAINLLKENSEIRNEIKNNYYEIMVDEYQDTNDIQEYFISLIENNNVYMVGDIKQSIYGFRNANPIIFKNKYDDYANNNGGIKIDLLKNFRSRSNVLKGINDIFNLIMDDQYGGANYVKEHQMNFGNHDYDIKANKQNYDLEVIEYDESELFTKAETEAFIIARDIQEKIKNGYEVIDKKSHQLRKATYADFCIIMDRGSSFTLYKKIFEYLGLPMTIYLDQKLTTETDILIIKNIYTLIMQIHEKIFDIKFRYAFMSVARSFLFEMNDDEILKIFTDNAFYKTELYLKCQKISDKVDYYSNYDTIKHIVDSFDFYEKTIKVGNIEETITRINSLLDIAKDLESVGYSYADFYDYLSLIIESDFEIRYKDVTNDSDSVKLMNIHKSKGLEFPICYFSGFYKTFNKSDIKDRFVYDKDYGFVTPYFKNGIGNMITKDLLINKFNDNDISEKIRLLYVALTRAKEKMIMIMPCLDKKVNTVCKIVDNSIRKRYSSFLDIIYSIKGNLTNYYRKSNLEDLKMSKEYLNSITSKENSSIKVDKTIIFKELNIKIENEEEMHASKTINKLLSKEEYKNIEYGKKVHEALELTNFLDIDDNNPFKDLTMKLKNKLNITNKTKIYKEYEFIYEDTGLVHGIIDLVLIEDREIKIVDYKLSDITDDAYQKQLKEYAKFFQKVYNMDVKTYLYSVLNDELLEVK